MMASAIQGVSPTARTGARQRPSNTPASMALASGPGMAATQRPKGFHRPAATSSRPQTRKAPTADAKPPSSGPEVAKRAAPGVDQATLMGSRLARLR